MAEQSGRPQDILTLEQILSVTSIEDLRNLYLKEGGPFEEANATFFQQVEHDWLRGVSSVYYDFLQKGKAGTLPLLPPQPPSIEVAIDGVTYTIYGEDHVHAQKTKGYQQLFAAALRKHENVIFEQGLRSEAFNGIPSIELGDHMMIPFGSATMEMVSLRFKLAKTWRSINPLIPPSEEAGIPHALIDELHIPLQLYFDLEFLPGLHFPLRLPPYVRLEYLEMHGKLPTDSKRSAYMAGIMRLWKPTESKAILPGAFHSSEIPYFLVKEVKDHKLQDRIHTDADILNSDPGKYEHLKRVDSVKKFAMKAVPVIGGALGYVSYFF